MGFKLSKQFYFIKKKKKSIINLHDHFLLKDIIECNNQY